MVFVNDAKLPRHMLFLERTGESFLFLLTLYILKIVHLSNFSAQKKTVLILVGNSEIDVHMWSEIGNLIYLRHSVKSTAVSNWNLFS